jgi:hypothetical protein
VVSYHLPCFRLAAPLFLLWHPCTYRTVIPYLNTPYLSLERAMAFPYIELCVPLYRHSIYWAKSLTLSQFFYWTTLLTLFLYFYCSLTLLSLLYWLRLYFSPSSIIEHANASYNAQCAYPFINLCLSLHWATNLLLQNDASAFEELRLSCNFPRASP